MKKKTQDVITELLANNKAIIKNCRLLRDALSELHEMWWLTDKQYERKDEDALNEMFSKATESVHYLEKLGIDTMKAFYLVDEWLYD